MPELAEVETTRRDLSKIIEGRVINKVSVFLDKIVYNKKNEFIKNVNKLDALSPLKTLARGYSVALNGDKVIRSKADIDINEKFVLKLNDGEIKAIREE